MKTISREDLPSLLDQVCSNLKLSGITSPRVYVDMLEKGLLVGQGYLPLWYAKKLANFAIDNQNLETCLNRLTKGHNFRFRIGEIVYVISPVFSEINKY